MLNILFGPLLIDLIRIYLTQSHDITVRTKTGLSYEIPPITVLPRYVTYVFDKCTDNNGAFSGAPFDWDIQVSVIVRKL